MQESEYLTIIYFAITRELGKNFLKWPLPFTVRIYYGVRRVQSAQFRIRILNGLLHRIEPKWHLASATGVLNPVDPGNEGRVLSRRVG